MCLKVKSPWPMPADTAEVGKKLLKAESAYRLIGEKLFEQLNERDYADLYPSEGQPGLSPIILAFVTVFQYMEKMSDRQAAEGLRMRMDWKYALHLPLGYEGFDYSVLSEFRERLLKHNAEERVFDQLVRMFQEMGLIKKRGRQRTDSFAILTKVRWISRLELVVETMRVAVGAILEADREWGEAIIPPSWEERYGERFIQAQYSEKERQEYEKHIGQDGQWLIARLEGKGVSTEISNLPEVQLLKTVWTQQFHQTEEQVVFRKEVNSNGHEMIFTPHDPEARYSKKRGKEWVGGKVQITETDDKGYPHLITDIAATSSTFTDYKALPNIQSRLEKRECLPGKQYVDNGYMGSSNLYQSSQQDIDLIGPIYQNFSKQQKLKDGITSQQFNIDLEEGQATCPAGVRVRPQMRKRERIRFHFPDEVCASCSLRPRCCLGKSGRTINVSEAYPLLQAARKRQETAEFKQDYYQHRSGIEGCGSAVLRSTGMRISRYTSNRKRHLQAVFSGLAVNIKRTAVWLAGKRPKRYRNTWRLTPTATG